MILVTGSTGFIGRHLVKELYREGYPIRCLVRDPGRAHRIRKSDAALGDVRDYESLLAATKGCSSVIHLAAPIGHNDYKTNYDVTVAGTRNLVKACKANKTRRIIFISSIAALDPKTNYGKTKLMAEKILLSSGLNVTILRPDWVYGEGDWSFSVITRVARRLPFFAVPGNGQYLKRPIYAGDVVEAILSCIERKTTGKIYLLGGPAIPLEEMLDTFFRITGNRKWIVHLPIWLLYAIAAVCEALGIRRISKTAIHGLTFSSDYRMDETENELGIKPVPFPKCISRIRDYYLGRH